MRTVEFDWTTSIECKLTNETVGPDCLDRAKYAAYLTSYLSTYRTESYVLNLNCAWGTGKTYFLKRWANSIYTKHPVIYLDAWKNDNHNHPLLLVLGELVEKLKALMDGEKSEAMQSLLSKSGGVIKAVAPELAKGLVKKLLSINVDKVLNDVKATDSKVAEGVAAVAVKELLSLHSKQNESVEMLKKEVEELLSCVITDDNADGNQRWSPMYIFIDELDRCRPTFAIELLEVVKHIFSMRRVIFVIATDTEQLQHSITAVYGQGFASRKYLMRFFDRSFSLPMSKTIDYVRTMRSTALLQERILLTNDLNIFAWDEKNSVELLALIFDGFSLDLRSINQIVERISGVLVNHPEEQGVVWLVILECMRGVLPEGYEKMLAGEAVHQPGTSSTNGAGVSLLPLDVFIFKPLSDMTKIKDHIDNQKMVINKSALTYNVEIEKRINIGTHQGQAIFELKKCGQKLIDNQFVLFRSIIQRISIRYSSHRDPIETNTSIEPIDAYIWLTEKENLNRFREYVEIAGNLS